MINFKNTYNHLPDVFHKKVKINSFPQLECIKSNEELLKELGIKSIDSLVKELKYEIDASKAACIAMAYAGHQFGHFVPQLGDGRAMLLGEVSANGKQFDIHLKGSGQTPFSRRGDGRSSLGPVIREYILSEAMHALGVPTTRALAAFTTGETVYREEALPGGLFARVAKGHIRVGTFEFFAMQGKMDEVELLADYAIKRLYPEIENEIDKYQKFFRRVSENKIQLVAKWLSLGFIHGVMNTDNTSIAGETIDYGPCAFMDKFKADKVFSSIDRYGRYAYSNQMDIALWNMSVLAHCLLPLIAKEVGGIEKAEENLNLELEALTEYASETKLNHYLLKMGIKDNSAEAKDVLGSILNYMEKEKLDFTNTFARMLNFEFPDEVIEKHWLSLIDNREEALNLMRANNPLIIPRNHQVEKAIQLANYGDFTHFFKLIKAYQNPYDVSSEYEELKAEPKIDEIVYQTFCGT